MATTTRTATKKKTARTAKKKVARTAKKVRIAVEWGTRSVSVAVAAESILRISGCFRLLTPKLKEGMSNADANAAIDAAFENFSRCMRSKT